MDNKKSQNRSSTLQSPLLGQNIDIENHVTGKSVFVDDIPISQGTLFAKVFTSPVAHGTITKLDFSQALHFPGVIKIIDHTAIPGENEIGGIIKDEPLLADKEVHFCGQPILIIVAESSDSAEKACQKITIDIDSKEIGGDPR